MSQFDQTTDIKKLEAWDSASIGQTTMEFTAKHAFAEGRNSTKASMEILARAIDKASWCALHPEIKEAIAQVKANGDWPLEE